MKVNFKILALGALGALAVCMIGYGLADGITGSSPVPSAAGNRVVQPSTSNPQPTGANPKEGAPPAAAHEQPTGTSSKPASPAPADPKPTEPNQRGQAAVKAKVVTGPKAGYGTVAPPPPPGLLDDEISMIRRNAAAAEAAILEVTDAIVNGKKPE